MCMSTFVTEAIDFVGKIVVLLGVLILIVGTFCLRIFFASAWSFKWLLVVIGAGLGILALGEGLMKLARSRESAESLRP
jgi:hypothetical protein